MDICLPLVMTTGLLQLSYSDNSLGPLRHHCYILGNKIVHLISGPSSDDQIDGDNHEKVVKTNTKEVVFEQM